MIVHSLKRQGVSPCSDALHGKTHQICWACLPLEAQSLRVNSGMKIPIRTSCCAVIPAWLTASAHAGLGPQRPGSHPNHLPLLFAAP